MYTTVFNLFTVVLWLSVTFFDSEHLFVLMLHPRVAKEETVDLVANDTLDM